MLKIRLPHWKLKNNITSNGDTAVPKKISYLIVLQIGAFFFVPQIFQFWQQTFNTYIQLKNNNNNNNNNY